MDWHAARSSLYSWDLKHMLRFRRCSSSRSSGAGARRVGGARRIRDHEPQRAPARRSGLHRDGRDEARPQGAAGQAGEKAARRADEFDMGNSYHVPVTPQRPNAPMSPERPVTRNACAWPRNAWRGTQVTLGPLPKAYSGDPLESISRLTDF